ncbi:hypothetical protein Back11_55350 [Paenibacillus baekrokdamisoli]|uniref:Uncharacterized protein n=1 Tax=Paenibacillus baekrokdamisoli TaxID=1712516 RepID=A0A3G9IZ59_9BACL|nr:hypothetical protein [Paenibacillus baekrokdamisoli]MBB3071828.1 alpha-galactosidase [Paenibacillus baekrokdamisoli]BBH24190.1 hypothetical protein Back11_55350 [Paenibacillus baekrokdamisoli]
MSLPIMREPNVVLIETEAGWKAPERVSEGQWQDKGLELTIARNQDVVTVELEAATIPVKTIKLRWTVPTRGPLTVLGDHWERAYGDLEWRGIVPERTMPWYFLTNDGTVTNGYGVKTGARSFCYWHLDRDGITFTADVRNGSEGVRLGQRKLTVAEIVGYEGVDKESSFTAATRFCAIMCERPVMPAQPVYGGNNWYYAYGNSSHQEILEDSKFMSSLASSTTNRPYMVIDDGWQLSSGGACNGGPWLGNKHFPQMEQLAGEMKEIGVKPGIWFRPLLTSDSELREGIRYTASGGNILDPSMPSVLDYIAESQARMVSWGFEMIKHDFSTIDMLGQWGFEMKSRTNALTQPFHDRTRTTAEITLDLYRVLAESSGKSVVIGCNTVSHLAAGLFEIQRTGDDTSGRSWERTRYMGINTLAFRMPQHGTFYSHDADCIGITDQIPWELNKQWLELLAGSGTPLFVSASPSAVTKEQEAALRAAFELAARPLPSGEPLDWLETTCPSRWLLNGKETEFAWNRESVELITSAGEDNSWWK